MEPDHGAIQGKARWGAGTQAPCARLQAASSCRIPSKIHTRCSGSAELHPVRSATVGSAHKVLRMPLEKERIAVLRDEPDNRILECVVPGKAVAVIAGDRSMLALRRHRGIRILSLKEYLVSTRSQTI